MSELLTELKHRLRITWDDEDAELDRIINRAKSYFKKLTGKAFSFELEAWETELLLERCRYVYNNAVDEFEKNFADELKRLILHVALEMREAGGEQENPRCVK
ncbi:head-tail connector protein [Lysinibacillus parviboronicapiens]|uniref:head-tail connector protein n=1 Tax=Lysinibacillus parviboronicapiens TaxID=436516 RepID=UPI000D3967C3|nr:head-tail connector protein [Lysinibacillus parviboronicapiens]